MKPNAHVDENGYDHVAQIWHCLNCHKPVEARGKPLAKHSVMSWVHYGYISYPNLYNPDGSINKPARIVLAPIPKQTGTRYCQDCVLTIHDDGCAFCGQPVLEGQEYSIGEYLERDSPILNSGYQQIIAHHDCLPLHFNKVRAYKEKYK